MASSGPVHPEAPNRKREHTPCTPVPVQVDVRQHRVTKGDNTRSDAQPGQYLMNAATDGLGDRVQLTTGKSFAGNDRWKPALPKRNLEVVRVRGRRVFGTRMDNDQEPSSPPTWRLLTRECCTYNDHLRKPCFCAKVTMPHAMFARTGVFATGRPFVF